MQFYQTAMIQEIYRKRAESSAWRKVIVVFLHSILWMAYFSLPFVFMPRMGPGNFGGLFSHMPTPLVVNNVFMILAFYVNSLILMPEFFNKKRWTLYILFTCLFAFGTAFVYDIAREIESLLGMRSFYGPPMGGMEGNGQPMGGGPSPRGMFEFRRFSFLYTFIMIWSISMVYFLITQLQQSKRHAEAVIANALQSELSFLKAQINPHFLFNTLNNIYALSLKKSDDAPKAIMKLSNLMRQLTNDTAVDYVPFEDEERFIRDYIELQQMRLSDKTTVNYGIEGSFNQLRIAARLLIPYIDNAFKYGVSNHTKSTIDIHFSFKDAWMTFVITNAIHSNKADVMHTSSGVGLENATRRLDLLYKNKYRFKQTKTDTQYSIHLEINLS